MDAKTAATLAASCYRVTFTASQRLDLPEYLGSTLRGAFGRAFRALACPSRFDEPCPIPSQCPYHLIFESSPPPASEALRTHEEIPRPFVIAPEWRLMPDQHPHPYPLPQRSGRGADSRSSRHIYEPGEELSFGLTLIGCAQEFFPHFVVALREMDRLGRGRQAIALARIEAPVLPLAPPDSSLPCSPRPAMSVPLPLCCGRGEVRVTCGRGWRLPAPGEGAVAGEGQGKLADQAEGSASGYIEAESITGMPHAAARIVYDVHDNVVRGMASPLTLADCAREPCPRGPVAIDFITQTRLKHEGTWARVPEFHIVFRRLLGRLSSMARFHCGVPLDLDFKAIIERAHAIRLVRNDTRWVSWSRYSSRQDKKMQWEGLVGTAAYEEDLAPFWPYLKFGQSVHVGHGATFGLGKYALRAG